MSIPIACSTLCLSKEAYPDLEDALKRIKEVGFSHVDLATFEGWQNIDPSWLCRSSEGEIDSLADQILSTGLKVAAFNSGTSKRIGNTDAGALEILLEEHGALIGFAERLNCQIITAQPCSIKQIPIEQAKDLTIEHSLKLAELHEGRSVTLTLEGHKNSALEDPKVALEVLQEIAPRKIGITYDNSHYTMQGFSLEDTKALLSYAPHIHIRTSENQRMQAPFPADCVNIEALMRELKTSNYQGAVSIEYFNGFDDCLENALKLKEFVEKLLA